MGQEILYCFKCLTRLTGADFDRGGATRLGNRASCTDCLPQLLASLTADEKRQFAQQLSRPKDTRRRDPHRQSSTHLQPHKPSLSGTSLPTARSRSSAAPLLWAVGGALVAAVAVYGLWPKTPPPPPPQKTALAPTPKPAEDPRLKAAKEAVERARASGDLAAWAAALRLSQGTAYAGEAREAHERLLAAKEAAELDAQTRALVDKADYGGAQAHLTAVRKRHDRPEWHALVDQALGAVRARAEAALPALREKAAAARRRGADAEVDALREQVARWGMPALLEDLDRAVAAVADEGWKPLFDGRTLDVVRASSRPFWRVEDGAIVKAPGCINAAQTAMDFTDAELRIRFEARGVDNMFFALRQSDSSFRVTWPNTESFAAVGDGAHELIFRCKGDAAEASIDGRPVKVTKAGNPVSGPLQFNAEARLFRITGIDLRQGP